MKYMGSKRAMLQNGLGQVLARHVRNADRFVDLFSGSGAVAVHVAVANRIPVLANDLQAYSAVLTKAIIGRRREVNWKVSWNSWFKRASAEVSRFDVPLVTTISVAKVRKVRQWCSDQRTLAITNAYGGHYFSPHQAVWIDAMRACIPSKDPIRTVALAALIRAASRCVAAPGHTAQPFQPTKTAASFLQASWRRDIVAETECAFGQLAPLYAQRIGRTTVGDANVIAARLNERDLVFIDPPYSGVHYSRFYHVLETIARGGSIHVTGVGRYPPPELRPRSSYSVATESEDALDFLLRTIGARGARAILTFPVHQCSNGLSGSLVLDIAESYFRISEQQIASRFSTLGGKAISRDVGAGRSARRDAEEYVLVLSPK